MSAKACEGAMTAGLVSVVIKTLNEEKKIARAIESALAAADELHPWQLEVVVADSCSTDRTVAIAGRYSVRVVQLARAEERGCGIGVQLGYAHCTGEWVYLMDGDMALAPGFLREALDRLRSDPALAGVGGAVHDERIVNAIDRIRVNNRSVARPGPTAWLAGGGLYRRTAIEAAGGYAADRNLRAYEEAELGLRLHAAGFKLIRLERRAVTHLGHDLGALALMRRHWRSRRAISAGVLLRSAIGQPWLAAVLRIHKHFLATLCWWLALFAGLLMMPSSLHVYWLGGWAGVSLAMVALLLALKRDVAHVLISIYAWHYGVAAILVGWFQPRVDPRAPVDAVLLHDGGTS